MMKKSLDDVFLVAFGLKIEYSLNMDRGYEINRMNHAELSAAWVATKAAIIEKEKEIADIEAMLSFARDAFTVADLEQAHHDAMLGLGGLLCDKDQIRYELFGK